MSRSTGYDFDEAGFLESAKSTDQIAFEMVGVDFPAFEEPAMIEASEMIEIGLALGAIDFRFRERDRPVQIFQIALSKQRIIEHGAERGRHGHGQAEANAVARQSFENLPEGDIGLGNGLEKPIFLQEIWILRMPYKGEVGMQQECEIAFSHRTCVKEKPIRGNDKSQIRIAAKDRIERKKSKEFEEFKERQPANLVHDHL